MKNSTILIGLLVLVILSTLGLIFLISLVNYTYLYSEWKNSISCNEVNKFAWNSPLNIPDELKENVTRCYTFTIGGSSNGTKLFENGNYIGQKYFGDYYFNMFSNPKKIQEKLNRTN